jgi:YHS domain-containing protein
MKRRVWLMVALAAALGGCSAGNASRESAGPSAECSVCRENGDLACLHVKVTDATPRAEYRGKTYYFCSDECREAFMKSPERYTGK